MFSAWKLDGQHILLILAFLVGLVAAGIAAFGAQPLTLASGLALGVLLINNVLSFLKAPPSSPTQALQEGEQSLTAGKAASRGFARLGVLAAFAVIGVVVVGASLMTGAPVVHPMAVSGQGCSWFSKNEPKVLQYGEKDVLCVFTAVMGGAASYGAVAAVCAPLTIEQVVAIASNLFDYFALGETDSGLASAALPPSKGLPSTLTAEQFSKLRAFCGR